ncbi:hypothetical protein BT96DRAFT_947680 [Gymnopus androsaceus JB14]|uniref:Uncharacterized protein n=1 Tax=Gymnopus androsaceus JB14 TaxID=1447944 RepID=A0A6A4GRF2_9AGAR|nr:hypothetical protein BT96DRAFT_947680 [Gymnopus androsaceus JB14]
MVGFSLALNVLDIIDDRFHSYENSCELFNYLLNSPSSTEDDSGEPAPVLPEQWLWDIIDDFIYQFQVLCSWRSKIKSKSDDELMMLADGTGVWSSYSVLNVLYPLIQKSKINEYILALKEEQVKGGSRTAEEIANSISPYTALPLYRTLGYFSVLGLLRVHVLLGDFTLGLKVMDQIGEFRWLRLWCQIQQIISYRPPSPPSNPYLNTLLYAIRTFVTVLNSFQRMQRMHGYAGYERMDQYDQIAKTADRTLALYAMCHSLVLPGSPFTRLDDTITNTAKERYGEQMGRMSKGESDALVAFEELFLYTCPKFINANSPPYDDPEAIALMLSADQESARFVCFLAAHHYPQIPLIVTSVSSSCPQLHSLRSFLHLYTSLTTEKLTSFLDLAKIGEADRESVEGTEAEEEAIQEMMVFKQSSKSLSRMVPARLGGQQLIQHCHPRVKHIIDSTSSSRWMRAMALMTVFYEEKESRSKLPMKLYLYSVTNRNVSSSLLHLLQIYCSPHSEKHCSFALEKASEVAAIAAVASGSQDAAVAALAEAMRL